MQLIEFLGRFLGPLLKSCLLLIKNLLKSLAKSALLRIHKKILGSRATALIVLDEEIEGIIKIVKSIEFSGLSTKNVTQATEYEVKEQGAGFLGMLLDTLGVSLLENMLAGKGSIRTGEGAIRVVEEVTSAKRGGTITPE